MRSAYLTLAEAVVTLYVAGPDGSAVGPAVWIGAADSLKLPSSLDEFRMAATGDAYQRVYHVDESHEISMDRVWAIPYATQANYQLSRNTRFAMEILWRDAVTRIFVRRTYHGVTDRALDLASRDLASTAGEFGAAQSWRAEYFREDTGLSATVPAVTDTSGVAHAGFFFDSPMITGTYLLGQYLWSQPFRVTQAKAIVMASQTSDTVLTLEIDGVMTSTTLTLAAGALGSEASASASLSRVIDANSVARWKVTSAPAAVEDCAVLGCVTLRGAF